MIKLTFRELKKNWFQYLSMFVITVLAVTLFLGFISNKLTLEKRAELYYKESNLADLVVQTSGFASSDREYLGNLGAEYRIFSDGSFKKEGKNPETAKIFVSDGEINKPYLTERAEGREGVCIDARIAALRGYSIGDKVTVEMTTLKTAFEETAKSLFAYGVSGVKEPVFEFEIVGLMHSVEVVNIYSCSPVYVSPAAFERALEALFFEGVTLPEGVSAGFVASLMASGFQTQALIRTDGDVRALKGGIWEEFAKKEVSNLIVVLDHDTMEAVVTIDGEVEQSDNMIYIFPVIFFLVSILVIMSSISRLILRERTSIGTFKALGLSNARIVWHYAMLSAVITLFGCLLGALIGPLIVPTVMNIKYRLTFSMPMLSGVVYSALWTLGTTAVVCLLSILIGVWASRSVIKENPAECMRPKQVAYHPHVSKKQSSGKAGNHVALSFRMAIRNIRINWGRSLMTIVGVMGCSALLVTSFGIGDTMQSSIDNDYRSLFYYDVFAPYSEVAAARADALLESGNIERLETVETYVVTAVSGEKRQDISLYVVAENSQMTKIIAPEKTNALSNVIAEILGVKAGDTVTFMMGGGSVSYTVGQITETSFSNGFYTTQNKFTEELNVPATSRTLWIKSPEADGVRDQINEAVGVEVAKTLQDRIDEVENIISSTNMMKYTLMVFAVLLSVVVLYNLSLLNVKERSRDMATLKVLGFTDFQVALSLFAEIFILTIIGTAVGCVFGYPLMYLVMKLNEVAAMAFVYSIEFVSYIYSVLVSIGTCIVINCMFGLLISRINMTESLKSVE